MAPKTNCNSAKLHHILAYFRGSGVAHSIKDLEKALPSIASINGMQVKDYLQNLQDENLIRVEKIGSINWYWSFPGEEHHTKQQAVEKVTKERDSLLGQVALTRGLLAEKQQCEDKQASWIEQAEGLSREAAEAKKQNLKTDIAKLKSELTKYASRDPQELERMRQKLCQLKDRAEEATEKIWVWERWFRNTAGMIEEEIIEMGRAGYGEEWDENEKCLREL